MFKFLHAADIHLDSPLKGLEDYRGAPVEQIRNATRRALANLVRLAIDESVSFVLIAGDIYDGDWTDYSTGQEFNEEMRRLRDACIPVYMISGNHDAANKLTRSLPLPENVRLLGHQHPETATIPEINVAIHGQSYATQAVHEDLSLRYPPAVKGQFNIGLLHTSATGREGHMPYAPCTIEGLRTRGYDYWALGHVHTRETLCEKPPIVFPGNLQGRHIRETGPKGAMLVTVVPGQSPGLEFRPLDVFRWERLTIDLTDMESETAILNQITEGLETAVASADGRPLAVRLELGGRTPGHASLAGKREHWIAMIRETAINKWGNRIWIEKVRVSTSPMLSVEELADASDGPIAEVAEIIRELKFHNDEATATKFDLGALSRKLPAAVARDLGIRDAGWLSQALEEAEAILSGAMEIEGQS